MSVEKLIENHALLICVGSGGVGKTTTAAAIGLYAAKQGKRVLVLTIDPARRLANSLGLSQFGNEETRIDLGESEGELWAMMLDTRTTFNTLIRRVSPDAETRDRILENRVYRHVADSFGGSQEYMATEQLYDVVTSGRYDLVVLDTPPVKNALDFLESPGRMARFLDKRILQWFLAPYEDNRPVVGRVLRGTSAVLFKLLGYVFGREFLDELAEFLFIFRDLYDGFRERHEAVTAMFHDASTRFVVVAAPNGPSVSVAHYFLEELGQRHMPIAGVIMNQMHPSSGISTDMKAELSEVADQVSTDLSPSTTPQLLARLGAAHKRMAGLAQAEANLAGGLGQKLGSGSILWQIPRLEGEVHDLESLGSVGEHMVAAVSG